MLFTFVTESKRSSILQNKHSEELTSAKNSISQKTSIQKTHTKMQKTSLRCKLICDNTLDGKELWTRHRHGPGSSLAGDSNRHQFVRLPIQVVRENAISVLQKNYKTDFY